MSQYGLDIVFSEMHWDKETEEPFPLCAPPDSTLLEHERHQLLFDHMEGLRRRSQRLHIPLTPEQNERTGLQEGAREVARNRQFRRLPVRRPVLPSLWRNDATVPGASNWTTRSRSPTSMPNSNVLVATITQSRASRKAPSASRRCSALSELWETKVGTPLERR